MIRVAKSAGFRRTGKLVNKGMSCGKSSDRVPSEKNCMKCYGNLFKVWLIRLRELPFMSGDDVIDYLAYQKHEMEKVRVFSNTNFMDLIDTKLVHAIKLREEERNCEKSIPVILPLDEILSKLDFEKIAINDKKGEFGIKVGWFFFNPKNPEGLHLSKKYNEVIIQLIRERFVAFDGSPFSHRYMLDNIAVGRNKKVG